MIFEKLMSPGSYTIPLRIDAPYGLWGTVKPVTEAGGGHIVVTPQHMNPRVIGDTGMLAAARYAGPVLEKTFNDGAFTVGGAGMGWWLGDDYTGDVYETAVVLSNATLTAALTALVPSAISIGTVVNTVTNFTGTFHYDIPRDAVATVMAATKGEYRVNPDGSIDAGQNSDLFTTSNPTVVVTRFGSGSDPNLTGVPGATVKSVQDSRGYASRALLITVAADGSATLDASANQSPAATGKDILGNTIVRTLVYETAAGDPSTSGGFLTSELAEHIDMDEATVSTGFWELSGGTWNVGDAFWVYDDPAFVDVTNQIRFRGDVLHPKKMRLVAASWPLIRGMGVAFRDDTGTYTDLTDWIRWEAQDQTAGLVNPATDLGARIAGASMLTIRSFVEVAEASS